MTMKRIFISDKLFRIIFINVIIIFTFAHCQIELNHKSVCDNGYFYYSKECLNCTIYHKDCLECDKKGCTLCKDLGFYNYMNLKRCSIYVSSWIKIVLIILAVILVTGLVSFLIYKHLKNNDHNNNNTETVNVDQNQQNTNNIEVMSNVNMINIYQNNNFNKNKNMINKAINNKDNILINTNFQNQINSKLNRNSCISSNINLESNLILDYNTNQIDKYKKTKGKINNIHILTNTNDINDKCNFEKIKKTISIDELEINTNNIKINFEKSTETNELNNI